jgi:hypothetical protein
MFQKVSDVWEILGTRDGHRVEITVCDVGTTEKIEGELITTRVSTIPQ